MLSRDDVLIEARRRDDQFPIRAPGRHRLWDVELGEALVAGGIAFIHRQQSFMVGEQGLRGIGQYLSVHR